MQWFSTWKTVFINCDYFLEEQRKRQGQEDTQISLKS